MEVRARAKVGTYLACREKGLPCLLDRSASTIVIMLQALAQTSYNPRRKPHNKVVTGRMPIMLRVQCQ